MVLLDTRQLYFLGCLGQEQGLAYQRYIETHSLPDTPLVRIGFLTALADDMERRPFHDSLVHEQFMKFLRDEVKRMSNRIVGETYEFMKIPQ